MSNFVYVLLGKNDGLDGQHSDVLGVYESQDEAIKQKNVYQSWVEENPDGPQNKYRSYLIVVRILGAMAFSR